MKVKSLAEEMYKARYQHDCSFRMFAKVTKFPHTFLCNIENKKISIHSLRFSTAKRIASIIGASLDDLYLMNK